MMLFRDFLVIASRKYSSAFYSETFCFFFHCRSPFIVILCVFNILYFHCSRSLNEVLLPERILVEKILKIYSIYFNMVYYRNFNVFVVFFFFFLAKLT